MTNCSEKCKVWQTIEKCREACLACSVCSEGNSMQLGGGGLVSFDKCGVAGVDALKNRVRREASAATGGVTALPPDIEDTLRRVFADFVSLDPLDVLLVRHVANGGSLTTFRDAAGELAGQLAALAGGSYSNARISAWKRFGRVIRKFRYASAIAGPMFGKGHSGPLKAALRRTPVQESLFGDETPGAGAEKGGGQCQRA